MPARRPRGPCGVAKPLRTISHRRPESLRPSGRPASPKGRDLGTFSRPTGADFGFSVRPDCCSQSPAGGHPPVACTPSQRAAPLLRPPAGTGIQPAASRSRRGRYLGVLRDRVAPAQRCRPPRDPPDCRTPSAAEPRTFRPPFAITVGEFRTGVRAAKPDGRPRLPPPARRRGTPTRRPASLPPRGRSPPSRAVAGLFWSGPPRGGGSAVGGTPFSSGFPRTILRRQTAGPFRKAAAPPRGPRPGGRTP